MQRKEMMTILTVLLFPIGVQSLKMQQGDKSKFVPAVNWVLDHSNAAVYNVQINPAHGAGKVCHAEVRTTCESVGMLPVCHLFDGAKQSYVDGYVNQDCIALAEPEGFVNPHPNGRWWRYDLPIKDGTPHTANCQWDGTDPAGLGYNYHCDVWGWRGASADPMITDGPTFVAANADRDGGCALCGIWNAGWCYTGGMVTGADGQLKGYAVCGTYDFTRRPGAGAKGDPHLMNIKGEKFNVHRQGDAPLLNIASDEATHLEVFAFIQGHQKCQKSMFITRVNSSGSWLEKNVAVTVGGQTDIQAFSVVVDGQEVWSPASREYKPPTTDNIVFDHAGKFSINELAFTRTSANQPGVELKMAHDVKMKIMRPLHSPKAPPHLNFDIQGLNKLPRSFKLGGLLGHDDHSFWSNPKEGCGTQFAKSKEAEVGSIASAH